MMTMAMMHPSAKSLMGFMRAAISSSVIGPKSRGTIGMVLEWFSG